MMTRTNGGGEGWSLSSSSSSSRDLESYQLGRGVVVVVEEDRVDRRRGARSSPIERFSLLADDDDDDDDDGDREEAGANGGIDEEDADDGADDRGGNMGPRSRRRRWLCRCAILSVGASLAAAVASSARARAATGVVPATSSYWGRDSTTSSCPAATARASYSVSSEIMDLRNSSTVENVFNGAVATDDPVCSQVGLDVLREGGNAADASIASVLCLGTTNPASSGIGGGAFILVHSDESWRRRRRRRRTSRSLDNDGDDDDDDDITFVDERARRDDGDDNDYNDEDDDGDDRRKVAEFIDCRETAPGGARWDAFRSLPPEASTVGGLSVAVPGELRGLELLHRRHGSMPWSRLVRPAYVLARDGFVVSRYLADAIERNAMYIRTMPDLGRLLTRDGDGRTPLVEGDVMVRGRYAETLRAIMEGGGDALYRGGMAESLSRDIQDAGGIITSADIANYRPVLRDPLISRVNGHNVVGPGPPSSGGGAVIGALRFLSGFSAPYAASYDSLSQHWYVEACRHVFAIRMSLSDPSFARDQNANAVRDLIEGDYMEMLRGGTSDDAVLNVSQYGGPKWAQLKDVNGQGDTVKDAKEGDRRMSEKIGANDTTATSSRNLRLFNYLDDHGTTSLSVIDKNKNTVTITSTINLEFGSKVLTSTGIILNNDMDDFSTPGRANAFGLHPSPSNYAAPGKRPLSSMSPTMVFRDGSGGDGPAKAPFEDLGDLVLSLGASGGPKIISAVLQTMLNYAFVGMPLFESVSSPRIHDQLLYHGAAGTNVEQSTLPQGPAIELSSRTRSALEKRGHDLVDTNYLGAVQAVAVDLETGSLTAVSDIRKQGMPAGY